MALSTKHVAVALFMIAATCLSSCYTEDPGPVQYTQKDFSEMHFDRIEIGDALKITIHQSNIFRVQASGDERNINDLIVKKEGSTLVVRFDESRPRRHDTEILITMPELSGANFTGASNSRIFGFEENETFDIFLSGASVCQLDMWATDVDAVVSGASYLYMYGEGGSLEADVSGASRLNTYQYIVRTAEVTATGASDAKVMATDTLHAIATGASVIRYHGNPVVISETSDSGMVHHD